MIYSSQIPTCPFCGGPARVRRWYSKGEACYYGDSDKGTWLGYRVGCMQCHAFVHRSSVDVGSRKKAQSRALEAWAARHGQTVIEPGKHIITDALYLSCPLCAGTEYTFRIVRARPSEQSPRLDTAQQIICEGCGLSLVALRRAVDVDRGGMEVLKPSLAELWNTRRTPAQYEARLEHYREIHRRYNAIGAFGLQAGIWISHDLRDDTGDTRPHV